MFYAAIQNEKDRTKIEKLYYEYRKLMYKEAYEILKDKTLAEDAVSESFIRIINNLHKIDENFCPRTRNFLVIICRNVAIDIYNSKKKTIPYGHSEEIINPIDIEDLVINRETIRRVSDIILEMDSKYRDVLILRRAYEMSREDIAKIFGISVEAVKKRLLRANNMIKAKLEMCDKDTPQRVWHNDSIQFAVATDKKTGARTSEFGFGISNGEVTLQRYTSQSINDGVVSVEFDKETKCAVKRYESEKKTVYELKIKLSDVYDVVPDAKNLKSIPFALCINDDDGEGRGWMEYTSGGIAGTKSTALYMNLPVYK